MGNASFWWYLSVCLSVCLSVTYLTYAFRLLSKKFIFYKDLTYYLKREKRNYHNDCNVRKTTSRVQMNTHTIVHAVTLLYKSSVARNIFRLEFFRTFSPHDTRLWQLSSYSQQPQCSLLCDVGLGRVTITRDFRVTAARWRHYQWRHLQVRPTGRRAWRETPSCRLRWPMRPTSAGRVPLSSTRQLIYLYSSQHNKIQLYRNTDRHTR